MRFIATWAIILFSAILRLYHIDFGLPALNDPDELMFQMGAIRMLRGGDLNPGWFGHPATTTMYVLALVDIFAFGIGYATGQFVDAEAFAQSVFADPTLVILPGRLTMAAFGVLTVWLTIRLTSEFFDDRAAISAGLVLAASPLAVSWAQVIRSDIMATAFLLATLIAVVRYGRSPTRVRFAWAAACLALSVATKWPYALGALAMVSVLVDRWRIGGMSLRACLNKIMQFGMLAIAGLLVVSPYLLLAHETLKRNLQGEAQAHHLGATGGSPWQNLMWYGKGPILSGVGAFGIALAVIGLILICRQKLAARVLLPVLLGFIAVLTVQHLVWDRWALPLIPLLAIAVGAGISWLWDRSAERALWVRCLLPTATLAAIVAPLSMASVDNSRSRAHDTRQAASAWARSNIPAGSTVLIEQFSFDLQSAPWHILFPMGDAGCVDAKAMLAGKIDYATIEAARGTRAIVDYGTVAPERVESCRADYAIIAQFDRYAAERKDFPKEYQMYQSLIDSGRERVVLTPQISHQSGPIVRVVEF